MPIFIIKWLYQYTKIGVRHMKRRKDTIAHFLNGIEQLIERNKLDTAERFLREYLTEKEHPAFLRKYGSVLRMNRKEEEAIEVLIPLLYTKECGNASYELSYAYASLGNYEKSLEYLSICVQNMEKRFPLEKIIQLENFIQENMKRQENALEMKEQNILRTLEHVIQSHGYDEHQEGKTYFDANVDVKSLLLGVIDQIDTNTSLQYTCDGNIRQYHFEYPSIGYDHHQRRLHVLSVIISYPSNVITMYPEKMHKNCSFINEFEYDAFNGNQPQKSKIRQSQIEKFYQKYGKMM